MPELRFPEFKDAPEWNPTTFGATATFINGKAYKQEELLENGKYRVLRVGNFFTNKEWYFSDLELDENKYCDNGDLLYAWSASFGPRIWLGEKVIYHYHIWKVLEKKHIDKNFLFILLDYETERMKAATANGLGLMHITKSSIENWKCCIPSSIEEQKKIADCLSYLDELISAHNQKLDALKAHKTGLMQQLFPAEGETVPKLRFPEFEGVWNISSLGKVASISSGGTPSRSMPSYWKGDIPWVSTTLIDFNKIKTVNESITELGLSNSSAKIFPKGTILMAMYGQGKTRGKVAILDIKASINQACAAISLRKGMNIEFVFQNLASRYSEIRDISNQGGQENLSAGLIKEIPFSYPDVESGEQQKIADCLSAIDELITAQSQKIKSLKTHKKGLMQQLFPTINEVNTWI